MAVLLGYGIFTGPHFDQHQQQTSVPSSGWRLHQRSALRGSFQCRECVEAPLFDSVEFLSPLSAGRFIDFVANWRKIIAVIANKSVDCVEDFFAEAYHIDGCANTAADYDLGEN